MFDLNSYREHVSSIADCIKIVNSVLQRNILNAQFESVIVRVDSNVLYVESAIEVF